MAEEANGKISEIIGNNDNNEIDRKKLKDFFQTEKACKTPTVSLFCKNKKSNHKNR